VHGTDPAKVEKSAFTAAEVVRKALEGTEAAVLGPAIAPFSKLKGRTRWHLLVKAPKLEEILPRLRKAQSKLPNDRRMGSTIDVDPQSLL
jgi:primosomal protein N'